MNKVIKVPGFGDQFKPHSVSRRRIIFTTDGCEEKHALVYFAQARNSRFYHVIVRGEELPTQVAKFRNHLDARVFHNHFHRSHMSEELMREHFRVVNSNTDEG